MNGEKNERFSQLIPPARADFFAYHQYKDYIIFQELLKIETVKSFRVILQRIIENEYEDYQFWLPFSKRKEFIVPWYEIVFFRFLRRVFGLTFTAKFLERDEREIIQIYQTFAREVAEPLRSKVSEILARERKHEQMLISQFQEGNVKFLGSIILGLNDGLVELSGALIGFSIAIGQNRTIGFLGLITGIAAAFSMSASSFLQARYSKNREAFKSALYTGGTYFAVVLLLVTPFFIMPDVNSSRALLIGVVFVIIFFTSFYSSIVLDRRFRHVVFEMILLSIGVSVLIFFFVHSLQLIVPGTLP